MKIRLRSKIYAHIIASIIFSFLIYMNSQAGILDYLDSKEIILIIGETKPLRVNNPRQLKIGNELLLDVVGAGRNELLLSGLAEGETSLTVVDDFGQQVYAVKIFQEDLEKVKERIDILLEAAGFDQLDTRIGDKERKVFLIGDIPSSKRELFESRIEPVSEKIVNLINFYDDVVSVEIDVEVLEIAKSDLDALGFSWDSTVTFSEPSTETKFLIENLLEPKHVLGILSDWRTTQFSASLDLLKKNNKARTLSRPKIVCMSGKDAKLLVGGERPIITGSTTSSGGGSTTTDYEIDLKEYGITLEIKPVVSENGMIKVGLNVEITDVDFANELEFTSGGNTISTPGFTERSAQTELSVPSGHTVFLAGMIKSYNKNNKSQVPFLGNIPIMGAIFRKKDLEQQDTEIVISLTPTILNNQSKRDISSSASLVESRNNKVELYSAPVIEKDDPIFNYSKLIQGIINSNIQYPQELSAEKIEGTVKLSLHLLSTGELSGALIMQSSGSQLLDQAAEYAVKKLSPFPAFPSDAKLKELWIDMPIVYKAKENI
ncbi:MAG: TonB family protein [Candidatus Omnitrophota bacterium]